MAAFVYSGVTYASPAAGTKEFALTSDKGNAIVYLSQSHIKVYSSTDAGVTWSLLTITTQYTFNSQGTGIVLVTGTTAGQQIRLRRQTPLSAQWVTFSDGSVLTSNQLNQAERFSLYCDQELEDTKSNIDGTVEGAAVKSVTGTAPIKVDNTNKQTPVVDIDQTDTSGDYNSLTSDTKVMSEKAIDEAFKQRRIIEKELLDARWHGVSHPKVSDLLEGTKWIRSNLERRWQRSAHCQLTIDSQLTHDWLTAGARVLFRWTK